MAAHQIVTDPVIEFHKLLATCIDMPVCNKLQLKIPVTSTDALLLPSATGAAKFLPGRIMLTSCSIMEVIKCLGVSHISDLQPFDTFVISDGFIYPKGFRIADIPIMETITAMKDIQLYWSSSLTKIKYDGIELRVFTKKHILEFYPCAEMFLEAIPATILPGNIIDCTKILPAAEAVQRIQQLAATLQFDELSAEAMESIPARDLLGI